MSITLISYLAANDPVELEQFPEAVVDKAKKVLENKHSLINTYHVNLRAIVRTTIQAYEELPTIRLIIILHAALQVLEEFETAVDEPIKRLDGETEEDYKIRTVLSHLFH